MTDYVEETAAAETPEVETAAEAIETPSETETSPAPEVETASEDGASNDEEAAQ